MHTAAVPTAISTADSSLALAEARYRSLLEAALDEIVVFSRDGHLSVPERRRCRPPRQTGGNLIGRAFTDVFPPSLAAATEREIHTVCSTRAPAYSEQEFAFPDGRTSWMSVWFVPLDTEGTLLGIARDITARKIAKLAVLESRERFRLIAESIEEVFWLANGSLDEIDCAGSRIASASGPGRPRRCVPRLRDSSTPSTTGIASACGQSFVRRAKPARRSTAGTASCVRRAMRAGSGTAGFRSRPNPADRSVTSARRSTSRAASWPRSSCRKTPPPTASRGSPTAPASPRR